MTNRKNPTTRQRLAAALLQLVRYRAGKWEAIIDYEEAKNLTADEIISRFELDHYPVSVKLGGSNHPTNLTWREKEEHREKTNKVDAKIHAKARRFEKNPQKIRSRGELQYPSESNIKDVKPKRKIPSRPFPNRRKK